MKTMRITLILLLVLISGAAPVADPEALMRAGDAAAVRGDFEAAVAYFSQALERTTDPAPAAFNLAVARLHLASTGSAAEAGSKSYARRNCSSPASPAKAIPIPGAGPRPSTAWAYVGCSVPRRATWPPRVPRSVVCGNVWRIRRSSRRCVPTSGTIWRGRACWPGSSHRRRNRASSRIRRTTGPDKPPQKDPNAPGNKSSTTNNPEKKPGDAVAVPPDGGEPRETSARNPHGRTGPPTIPDNTEPTPLTAGDAAIYLQKAAPGLTGRPRAAAPATSRQPGASGCPRLVNWSRS